MLSENEWRQKKIWTQNHIYKKKSKNSTEWRQGKRVKKGWKVACVCLFFWGNTSIQRATIFFGVAVEGEGKANVSFSLPNNIDYYNWLMFTFHAKLCVCIFFFLSTSMIFWFFFQQLLLPFLIKCSLTEHGINF